VASTLNFNSLGQIFRMPESTQFLAWGPAWDPQRQRGPMSQEHGQSYS
jgi:hypothetical protein